MIIETKELIMIEETMQIPVPANYSFDCPEGTHNATLYQLREVKKIKDGNVEKFLRLVFKVDALSDEHTIILVGRNFVPTLELGSDLRTFIDTWLGQHHIEQNKTLNGAFNVRSLEQRGAVIVVNRIENEGYDMPYVHLVAAYPPGTKIKARNIYQRRKHEHN
jgi:hypothetical protein